jgi:Leucine rich repeat
MEIKCEFTTLSWNRTEIDYYRCKITEASITKPGTEIKSFVGKHLPFRSNKDVTAISFHETIIDYFPRNLHIIFPNLKALQIIDCSLKMITRDDLVGLQNLERFSLDGNKLTSLSSNLFIGFRHLKSIRLDANKLEFLSSKLLEPIAGNELERVDFRNNWKIHAFYQPGKEQSVFSLQTLMDAIDKDCKLPRGDKENEMFAKAFAAGFGELWTSKDFADYTIIGGFDGSSMEFAVHKNVLATQSSVMFAVFKNRQKAQTR